MVWPGCSSTALLSAPVTAVFAQAVMWGWQVPRDLSLLVLTPDALPVKEDCPRALARLCSHIYSPHLLTRMPMFPLETKWPWPLASRARYAAESKSEDYFNSAFTAMGINQSSGCPLIPLMCEECTFLGDFFCSHSWLGHSHVHLWQTTGKCRCMCGTGDGP